MKTPEFIDHLGKEMFGRSRTEAQEQKLCITCGNKIEGFKDEISAKEYAISGMCQKCQDEVFG